MTKNSPSDATACLPTVHLKVMFVFVVFFVDKATRRSWPSWSVAALLQRLSLQWSSSLLSELSHQSAPDHQQQHPQCRAQHRPQRYTASQLSALALPHHSLTTAVTADTTTAATTTTAVMTAHTMRVHIAGTITRAKSAGVDLKKVYRV